MDWSNGRPNFTDFVEKNMENLEKEREILTPVKGKIFAVKLPTETMTADKIEELE